MSSGTIYNESKLFVSGTIYNEIKLSECQAVQFTMKVNFLNVKRYNLQWK